MQAYVYAADLWCHDCAATIFRDLARDDRIPESAEATCANGHTAHPLPDPEADQVEGADPGHLICADEDCAYSALADEWDWDESSYCSYQMPKGPYPDGGGEADTPEHCGGCHVHLENDLTPDDGYSYVGEAIQAFAESGAGQGEVIREWLNAYPDAFDNVLHRDVTRALLGLRRSPAPFQVWHAEGEPPFANVQPACEACLKEREQDAGRSVLPESVPSAEFLFPDRFLNIAGTWVADTWRLLCARHVERYAAQRIVWAPMFRLLRVD